MYNLIKALDSRFPFSTAKAHCDIPCGIYDPITAQIAALTVVRMTDLLLEHENDENKGTAQHANSMSRYIAIKEEHAEKAKHEIRIIWGDFIKPAHIEKFPELHELTHSIMMLGSTCRQKVDRDSALKLVAELNRFAEIFWKIKGEETVVAKAPYAPGLDIVYRKV